MKWVMASSYATFCILNKPTKSHRFEGLVPMLCKFGKQWHTSEAGATGGKLMHLGYIFRRDLETLASSTLILFPGCCGANRLSPPYISTMMLCVATGPKQGLSGHN